MGFSWAFARILTLPGCSPAVSRDSAPSDTTSNDGIYGQRRGAFIMRPPVPWKSEAHGMGHMSSVQNPCWLMISWGIILPNINWGL